MDALTIIPKGGLLTMSSPEIAELLEKRHDIIKVSADRLAERGIIGTPEMQEFSEAIEQARDVGAGDWCAKVQVGRAALRRKAMEAKCEAHRQNQRKAMRTTPPGQGDPFGGVTA